MPEPKESDSPHEGREKASFWRVMSSGVGPLPYRADMFVSGRVGFIKPIQVVPQRFIQSLSCYIRTKTFFVYTEEDKMKRWRICRIKPKIN